MLSLLHIENIAVIESADISFTRGFNVLTGETGAGKSIVIDAICAIMGERAYREKYCQVGQIGRADIWNQKGEKQRFVTEFISRQTNTRKLPKITSARQSRLHLFTTAI